MITGSARLAENRYFHVKKKRPQFLGPPERGKGKEGKSGKAMLVFPYCETLGLKESNIDEEG